MSFYFPIEILNSKCFPEKATEGSAALDLRVTEDVSLTAGQTQLVGLGFRIRDFPEGYGCLIIPRSGLGGKGLILANLVGLIDPDYRGELKAKLLWDPEDDTQTIDLKEGDRVAQMMVVPCIPAQAIATGPDFEKGSERGHGGFGSTGDV